MAPHPMNSGDVTLGTMTHVNVMHIHSETFKTLEPLPDVLRSPGFVCARESHRKSDGPPPWFGLVGSVGVVRVVSGGEELHVLKS